MNKINYHVHTTGSDGKLTPEEVIENAIKCNVTNICFTDHYPAPEGIDLEANGFYPQELFDKLIILKEKYKNKIDISIGAEFDFVEGFDDWYKKEIQKRKYDYLIGSVHRVIEKKENVHFWDSKEKKADLINKMGKKEYVKRYYEMIKNMIKSGLFDGVGHFDIIKLINPEQNLFDENEDWYRKEVKETLDVLDKSGMCLEINMRGFMKQGEDKQYPSFWILQETKKRNIPITIGNDFHNKGGDVKVDDFLDKAYELAKKADYTKALIFKNRKPIEVEL